MVKRTRIWGRALSADEKAAEEFNSAFARLDHVEEHLTETRVDAMWRRHIGQWWRVRGSMILKEALRQIETTPLLQPPT